MAYHVYNVDFHISCAIKIKGSITTSHTPNSNTDDNSNNTNTELNDKIMDAKYVIEECER